MLGDETWILLTGDHAQLHERRRAHELRGCDNASLSQQGHTNTCCLRPPPTGLSRAMDGSDAIMCVIVDASGARLERVNPYESITPCIESGTHVQISNAL
jgi:hypothetical protein